MTQRLLIPLVATLATVASASALAQGDETFDASSVGSPSSVSANGVVNKTTEAGPSDAPSPQTTVAAKREADLEAAMAAQPATTDDDTTSATPAAEQALPEAESSDYGANDFRAPDDSEIAAARNKARRDASTEHDTGTPADDITGEQSLPAGDAMGDTPDASGEDNDARPIGPQGSDGASADGSADRQADRQARAAQMTAPPSPNEIDTDDY